MGRAAAGTPRLLPRRGCPWDPQPTGELLLRGGSPEPPPLSPGSQEGTATGHRLHRAAAAAHSKGRAGNEPRPRRGLQAVQCHGHAVVALSLLSAQAGPSRLVREKNILFSPRKALPFHRAPGSCPGNHRPHRGAGSPALLGTNCWEQHAGLGGSAWRGQVWFKGPKSGTVWKILVQENRTIPSSASPVLLQPPAPSQLGPGPVTAAPAQPWARPWLCPALGSCSLCPCCRPAGCRAVAGAAGLPRWETGPLLAPGLPGGPSPAGAAAPRDGVSPTPCCSSSALQPGAPPAPCRLPAARLPPGSCRRPEVHRESSRG